MGTKLTVCSLYIYSYLFHYVFIVHSSCTINTVRDSVVGAAPKCRPASCYMCLVKPVEFYYSSLSHPEVYRMAPNFRGAKFSQFGHFMEIILRTKDPFDSHIL